MKKSILSIAILLGSYGLAVAGSCAVGTAVLSNDPASGGTVLSCPGWGTCFETNRSDPKFLQPGDIIEIHMGGTLIQAVVQSADVNSKPGSTPSDGNPNESYFDIDGKIIISNI